MRALKWILLACLSLWVGCGLLKVVDYHQHHQTWTVSIPSEMEMTPELRLLIEDALRRRAWSLASLKIVDVRSIGDRAFEVSFSAPKRTPEVIENALTRPGDFSIRMRSTHFKTSHACELLNPEVIRPIAVEHARVTFGNSDEPLVSVLFDARDTKVLRDFSRANEGREIAACLDRRILTAGRIDREMTGLVALPGFASIDDALTVAAIIHGGPLPDGLTAMRRSAEHGED